MNKSCDLHYSGGKGAIFNTFSGVGVVGNIGSSKTTFLKLLTGHYRPASGRILIDDFDLADYSLDSWYDHISMLFQKTETFETLSIREYLELGRSPRHPELSTEDSIKQSGVSHFIDKLRRGPETIMSKSFEGGQNVSSGQEQLVKFAQCLLRNTPLMVFDEPTSNLDAQEEAALIERVRSLDTKTRILSSHSYGTLAKADRIIVFKDGEIEAFATHHELMRISPTYRENFSTQANAFQRIPRSSDLGDK